MLFNSIDFLLFFIIIAFVFYLIKPKYRWILLLIASYFFYMYWRWEYIFLIIFSTLVDYGCGINMTKQATKAKRLPYLLISIVSNLGLLFTFKYLDFFTNSFNVVFDSSLPMAQLILPMGISFYTFQTLSYSIEIYKGKEKCEPHLGKFALYVSFFPQLVAGPIERASHLLPQLQENKNKLNYTNIILGLTQVIIGFFKKVVVADLAAIYVNSIYNNYELHTGFTLVFATYLFAVQIYCDFSGYSDIAIGCSRMLGYDLMENFKQPYFSKSITEFWRRWHISLSTWLRDYLYIPLGGNRVSSLFTYRNLFITMLLGGLWHGASWNFVIWGGLHGLYLSIEKVFDLPTKLENASIILKVFSGFITFHLVCLAWVFFRAETFEQATGILKNIVFTDYFVNLNIQDTNIFAGVILTTAILVFLEIFVFRKIDLKSIKPVLNPIKYVFLASFLIILIIVFGVSEGSQFIYFQF